MFLHAAGFPARFIRHLLRTGGIRDLVIVSERQMVKGISRVVAVTGDGAKNVRVVTFSGKPIPIYLRCVIFNKNLLNKQDMTTPPPVHYG